MPLLFAVSYSAVGFSLFFALGLVADRGLGLTPLIFLGVGIVFLLNTLTYVEGEAMLPERGGSATFARAAFSNELVSFIAGWAIIIDYVIVIALAAISVPHYLTPLSSEFTDAGGEVITAGAVIAAVALMGIAGVTGIRRQRLLTLVALAGVLVLVLVIVVGFATSFDLDVITTELNPFDSVANPALDDLVYAGVIATVAFAGIEAAANLAPDLRFGGADLRKLVIAAATLVPLVYVGVSVVGLMALPVEETSSGAETALGTTYIENPVLGIVQSFEPAWVASSMEVLVVAVVPIALVWAASTAMLGLSRHVYVLAKNRQIPSWLGKLNGRFRTPHVAILVTALLAFGLVLPTDVELLGGLFAFGATIAFTIAHVSVIRLRLDQPDQQRPFRIPLNVRFRGAEIPLPTLAAAGLTAIAWLSVVVLHDTARWVGFGWMAFGLVSYVVYRKVFEGTTLTRRVEVPEEALVKNVPPAEYRRHPCARLRHAPRRRHRRDRGPARRRREQAGGRGAADADARLRDRGAAEAAVERPPLEGEAGGRRRGARALRAGRAGVRGCRGEDGGRALPLRRRRDRRDGARDRRRADRHGRRAADADQGRSGARRDRRGAAAPDRPGDRVRAEEGPVPGPDHGAEDRRGGRCRHRGGGRGGAVDEPGRGERGA